MNQAQDPDARGPVPRNLLQRLQQRGVLRVAISYAVIAWLTLQIGDVVLEPLGAPGWVMRALIVVVVAGFPIALLLAWYFELTPAGIERDTLPEAAARPSVRGVRRYTDVAIIGVLLLTVIVLLARQGGLLEEGRGPPVIGVLPFTELGASEEQAYFGDGLADTLTYKLGQLQQLIVLAPTSTFQFRGVNLDLLDVGSKLGATALLQGTVRRAGEALQVNARLVDTASGQQLWSGSYDRAGADLFAVQDEIAQAVTDALHLVLSPEESERLRQQQTDSLSAYDAYSRGRANLARRTAESTLRAMEDFREAIRLDPGFALGYAALVEALYIATEYNVERTAWRERTHEARTAAGKAQALAPESGEAWLAQAFAAMGDNQFGDGSAWPREHIAALLKRAVELNPNDATALKFYASHLDSSEEALGALERAARLDPRSAIIRHNLGQEYGFHGRQDDALRSFLEAAALAEPYFSLAYRGIVDMYESLGRFDEAARWARAFYRAHPEDPTAFWAYSDALDGLDARDEYQALLGAAPVEFVASGNRIWRLANLRANIVLGALTRDCARVIEATHTFGDPVPADGEPWPDMSTFMFGEPMVLARALCEWREGRPAAALQLLQTGLPRWNRLKNNDEKTWEFQSPVLAAALLKATGRRGEAEQVLAAFLAEARGMPIGGETGIGFSRYFALAVAGQTDAALDDLALAIESGWTSLWWTLELLDSDPEFAAVVAKPRFREIIAPLHRRIEAMRASYLANPELPAGYSIR